MDTRHQIEMVDTISLKPAAYNPRQISDWEMRKLMRSLENFGFIDPIIVNKDRTVIGGHQRLEAAKSLGMEQVPCIIVDVSKGLEKAMNLAFNNTGGENVQELMRLVLVSMTEEERIKSCLDQSEIEKLLGEIKKQAEKDEERAVSVTCPTCGQKVKESIQS